MNEGLAHVDGSVVPLSQARVPLLDRGHLLGDGVFETMRASQGRVLFRERHARRLARGLGLLGLPDAEAAAWKALDELLKAAAPLRADELYVRLQVTTGLGDDLAGEAGRHAVTAIARPLRPYPAEAYDPGFALVVAPNRKAQGPLAAVKTVSFLPHVAARRDARRRGADDALLLNETGRVCEATTSNVFAVVDGDLYAPGPEEGAVDGVTRAMLLEVLAAEGVRVRPALARDGLARASEILLTNTVAGVLPAWSLDGRELEGPKGRFYLVVRERLAGLRAAEEARIGGRRGAFQRGPQTLRPKASGIGP